MQQDGYSRDQVTQLLQGIAETFFKLAPERLHPEARLREDLDLDSIDLFDLVSQLEVKTGIDLDANDFRNERNVGELVDRLLFILNTPGNSPDSDPKNGV